MTAQKKYSDIDIQCLFALQGMRQAERALERIQDNQSERLPDTWRPQVAVIRGRLQAIREAMVARVEEWEVYKQTPSLTRLMSGEKRS